MREDTGWWIRAAETDLRSAEVLLEQGIYNNAAFFLQQAAEKAMKALLREHGESEPTHSGLGLMAHLRRLGVQFPERFDTDLRKLDRCLSTPAIPTA